MKRNIVVLLLICLCANAKAQIQTKFWGLELSQQYPSLQSAANIISDRCEYADIVNGEVLAMNGKLGQYSWPHITFSFTRGANAYTLYRVTFSDTFTSQDLAKMKYNSLVESLSGKYGAPARKIPTPWDSQEDIYELWSAQGSAEYICLIKMTKGKSKGGEVFWYVNLSYYNQDIHLRESYREYDEL